MLEAVEFHIVVNGVFLGSYRPGDHVQVFEIIDDDDDDDDDREA